MRNPFKSLFSPSAPTKKVAVKKQDVTDVSPPPYEQYSRAEPVDDMRRHIREKFKHVTEEYCMGWLKRCLIWRMAIDWELQLTVSALEKPTEMQYSTFEHFCEEAGSALGNGFPTVDREVISSLSLFEPAARIGIEKDLLEFFMFSIRQSKAYSGNRIDCHYKALILLRLVLDSKVIVDLVTKPDSAFAKKLKTRCTELHRQNFPWLLDPACISLDESVKARGSDACSKYTPNGRWGGIEMLLRECMRPCVASMDPALTSSAMYEVDMAYFQPDIDLRQQPEFSLRPWREHESVSPGVIICGPVRWRNFDTKPWAADELATASPRLAANSLSLSITTQRVRGYQHQIKNLTDSARLAECEEIVTQQSETINSQQSTIITLQEDVITLQRQLDQVRGSSA